MDQALSDRATLRRRGRVGQDRDHVYVGYVAMMKE
jgi:hypothetical protein